MEVNDSYSLLSTWLPLKRIHGRSRNRNYAETYCSLTAVTETESQRTPNCYPLLIRPPYIDIQHTLIENILCLTYVCLLKETPNRDCRHISVSHVSRARLHTTCNDPTETLQLNERPVTGPLYSDAACVMWNSYTDRSGGERGKLGEGGD